MPEEEKIYAKPHQTLDAVYGGGGILHVVSCLKRLAQLHNVVVYPARHAMAHICLFYAFFLDLELFFSLQTIHLPITFVIYTYVVLVTYKTFAKPQKIVFGLLPVAAILGNLTAMQVGAWLHG
ncbi:MAG TPA: hypothetical protein IAC53_03825 [Candidatus Fimenecus excrementigallinarum]|uniref:Uncharacterized protein n=1 Tax=Candidatus Fimenecus excrementigallinarum TaxID=2840816 RepID=A0A9D1IGP6_9FIRM|nr:hypothetical protein [Candidatus Fimenecus excrementigallinarum]